MTTKKKRCDVRPKYSNDGKNCWGTVGSSKKDTYKVKSVTMEVKEPKRGILSFIIPFLIYWVW